MTFPLATLMACLLGATPAAQPKATIVGPSEVQAGDLVVLRSTGSVGQGRKWAIVPVSAAARMFSFTERDASGNIVDSVAIFASRTPGTYTFILVVASGGEVDLALHQVKNGEGGEPDPDPPGPEPPEPDPTSDWARWAKATAEKHVPASVRKSQAQFLATVLRLVLSKVTSGEIRHERELREKIQYYREQAKRESGVVLDSSWEPHFDEPLVAAFQELKDDGKLSTLAQYAAIYTELAKGLEAVE